MFSPYFGEEMKLKEKHTTPSNLNDIPFANKQKPLNVSTTVAQHSDIDLNALRFNKPAVDDTPTAVIDQTDTPTKSHRKVSVISLLMTVLRFHKNHWLGLLFTWSIVGIYFMTTLSGDQLYHIFMAIGKPFSTKNPIVMGFSGLIAFILVIFAFHSSPEDKAIANRNQEINRIVRRIR